VETPSISIYTVFPNDDGHDEGGWGILGIDSQDEWLEVFVPVWTTTPFMAPSSAGNDH